MEIKPKYYQGKDGKDLFDRFEEGLLTAEEVRGFYKGNLFKYISRYQGKNGMQDLDKAETYLHRLKQFEKNAIAKYSSNTTTRNISNTTTGYLKKEARQYGKTRLN